MLSVYVAIALCSLPLIYWLHRFHRKPNTKVVSTLFLWPREKLRPITGRTKHRFVNNLSYWIETLIALLLILLLLPTPCSGDGQLHVWVVDTSASMSISQVQRVLIANVEDSGRYDKFTIVEAGFTPRILGQYQSAIEIKGLIDALQLNQSQSQMQEAIALAKTLTSGSIEVWTDGQTSTETLAHPTHTVHILGSPIALSNVGFVESEWKGHTLHTKILNASTQARTIQVTTVGISKSDESTPSTVQEISLLPNESTVLKSDLENGLRGLTIQIDSAKDALPADNTIYAVHPSPKPIRIATDLPQDLAAKLGALGDPAPIHKLVDSRTSSPMYSDILFTSRDLGGNDSTWRIHFASVKEQAWTQEVFMHTPHYTLEGVHLQNTLWQYDPNRRLRGRILLETNGVALLTEEIAEKSNRRILHFNMGSGTALLQQSEWPILLQNIFKAKQAELSGFAQSNIKMGEQVIGRGLENGEWTIVGPNGSQKESIETGTLSFTPTDFGTYVIQSPDGTSVHAIGVNLASKLESTPTTSANQTLQSTYSPEQIFGDSSQYQRWIWLAILGLLIVNWRVNR